MRTIFRLLVIVISITMILVGCSNNNEKPNNNNQNEQNQNEQNQNENDNKLTKHSVELYFADEQLMNNFRVVTEIETMDKEQLPLQTLEQWIQGPNKATLVSLIPNDVKVLSVEVRNSDETVVYVNFSSELKNANLGSGGEMFLVEQIALMMKQFGYDATQILIDGKTEESLFGHVSTDQPIQSPNPEDYETVN